LSQRVKERLRRLGLLDQVDHSDRVEIDREIERRTYAPCDTGVDMLTDAELRSLVEAMLLKRRKKKPLEVVAV